MPPPPVSPVSQRHPGGPILSTAICTVLLPQEAAGEAERRWEATIMELRTALEGARAHEEDVKQAAAAAEAEGDLRRTWGQARPRLLPEE